MEHLSLDTLARLVDERPTPGEREHLASCGRCAGDLRSMRYQTEALGALPAVRPPQGDWAVLEARLESEGLVRGGGAIRKFGFAAAPRWMQAAAAIVLFLGGTGFGLTVAPGEVPGSEILRADGAVVAVNDISTLDDAAGAVRFTEQQYLDALTHFRRLEGEAGVTRVGNPANRMAALETLYAASQEALRVAPSDLVFNGFLVNVLAERQEVFRQMAASSDDGWF